MDSKVLMRIFQFGTIALLFWLVNPPVSAEHLLPKHKLDCSPNFPCPAEIRRRVDFWIEVFKGWDKTKAILHDPQRPERVYMVLDTGQGCGRNAKRKIKSARKIISTSLESLATNLAKKRKIPNQRELHLLSLFPSKSPSRIRRAAKNIRCQSGVRDSFVAGLKRFNRYSGLVDRVLSENNLPPEIRYLPFVESSYNPAAYSKAGAAGLWQIMPKTARSLGLELNATQDERLNPEAATRAAAKYFLTATKSLSRVSKEKNPSITRAEINPFIITSYNYGVNGMRRAIQQISPDFMEVLNKYKSPSFQVAVKNFYASFLAARHVAINADTYFGTVAEAEAIPYQTLVLSHPTSIERIKNVFSLSEKSLRPFNQSLTRFIWNGWRMIPSGYQLRLPWHEDRWRPEIAKFNSLSPEKSVPGGDRYTVRKGDTACGIARAFRVNCKSLISANGLGKRAVIRIGQNLIIPRKVVKSADGALIASNSAASTPREWTVKRGQTACGIAKKAGVSCRELINLNRLGRKAQIIVGQKLKLPGGDFLAENVTGLTENNLYIVQKGDVACLIARRFSVSCSSLRKLNRLNKRATIYPGQKMKIPGLEVAGTTETAVELASVKNASQPNLAPTPNKREPAPPASDNALVNLLDTLPDLSVRVGSSNNKPVYYIFVEVDETLGHFADWLGIGGSAPLRKLNNLKSSTQLGLSEKLILPQLSPRTITRFEQMRVEYHQVLSETLKENYTLVGTEAYTVKPGDSLWQMSRQLGFPLWLIYRLNPELRLTGLSVGSAIVLPQLKRI